MKKRFLALFLLVAFVLLSYYCLPVIGHSGAILSAWAPTPPTIDGVLALGEWDAADTELFTLFGNPATIYVMNDANNLYIAVVTRDGTPGDASDEARFFFDNDNDGSSEKGENSFYVTFVPAYVDVYYETDGVPYSGWPRDTMDVPAGTNDGAGSSSSDLTYNYFEISFPLDSADDPHDWSLSIGDTVGFTLECYDETGNVYDHWPTISPNPEGYGDIVIASSPAPKAVGGEVYPVDKLSLLAPYIATILVIATTAVAIKKRID